MDTESHPFIKINEWIQEKAKRKKGGKLLTIQTPPQGTAAG